MHDVLTVAWKEWHELLRMGGTRKRALLRLVLSVGILGIIWPWQLGAQFVTGKLAILLAAISASMYVAGVVPDSFAGERERHTLETLLATRLPDRAILLGKVLALVSYGLVAAFVMMLFGWMTVNVIHRNNGVLMYSATTVVGAAVFSLLTAGTMAAVGVLVSLRSATVKQAQQILSTAVLIVLFMPAIVFPMLPPESRAYIGNMLQPGNAAGLAAALAGGLLLLQLLLYLIVFARFKRSKLILEH